MPTKSKSAKRISLPKDLVKGDVLITNTGDRLGFIVYDPRDNTVCTGISRHGNNWWRSDGSGFGCYGHREWIVAIERKSSAQKPKGAREYIGLYNRYIVSKTDGTPVDPKAEYFVLRLDSGGKDKRHIAACRAAAMTYAVMIHPHLPKLAEDLVNKYGPGKP